MHSFPSIPSRTISCRSPLPMRRPGGKRAAEAGLVFTVLLFVAGPSHGTHCPYVEAQTPALRWRPVTRWALQALRGGADSDGPRGGTLALSFAVICDSTQPGEDLGIVGECEELGKWRDVVRMTAAQVRQKMHF